MNGHLFDAAAAWICVVDADDRVTYANASLRQLLGGDAAAVDGAPALQFISPDSHIVARTLFDGARSGTSSQTDLALCAADGTERWVLATASALTGDPGASPQVLCVMVDVTERKAAEERLRHSEAQYRVLAETAEDHIFVINRDDRVEYVNQAAARQMRTVPEKLIGRRRTEIFPPDVADRQGQSLQRVFATGEPFYAEGRTMYLEREVWLGTWLVPVRDERGAVKAVLGLSRDMTEQRRSQAEASHAQKLEAIGRLAGGIAHDFNNNLAAILGYVELMLEDVSQQSAMAEHLREVQHAGQRASGLVRRLLAFGRRQVLERRDLSLNALVSDLTPMLQRLIGPRIRIDTRLAPDLRLVTADAGEVEQVIMNLALNARDAMRGSGTLTIETTNVGGSVRMTIRDTGAGMDAHVKERVFEPFFTTKPVGEGTGLGLATVYGIVTQLGGSVTVDSEVGQGAAFHVQLPAVSEPATAGPQVLTPESPAVVSGLETILLVEDEDAVRRFARAALERHGYHVIDAASPEQALALAESATPRPRLLLTDVVMPRMSGPELAERLTKMLPDLIVLYMSGYPSTALPGAGRDPSIRLISKPFTVAELMTAINAVLGQQ